MLSADLVIKTFASNQNHEIAIGQGKYMKNHFKFFGIPAPKRKALQKSWVENKALPTKGQAFELAFALYQTPYRECHYLAIELIDKFSKKFDIDDIDEIEFFIKNQSWWDTVDFIAAKIVGNYFKLFPQKRDKMIDKWLKSNDLWLRRSAILFQLKYKKTLDTALLSAIILQNSNSNEFFINKAIGWILREYSKTNPKWVKNFIESHALHPLSVKEGSKYL